MKIPIGLKIAVLTVASTLFYTYVGQLVPQKEVLPPQEMEIESDLTPEEMVETGRQIAEGKGMCLTCHTIGRTSGPLRFPDLEGIGVRAAERIPGMSALEYLTQSLYEPDAYIVPGFTGGMPVINRPPIGLTDQEILTVIAFLQSLGGTVTVTMDTRLPRGGETGTAPATAAAPPPAQPAPPAAAAGQELLTRFECNRCHRLDGPGPLQGPSLYDVGQRMDSSSLLAAILSPRGHQEARYFREATVQEVRQMAEILASKKGGQ